MRSAAGYILTAAVLVLLFAAEGFSGEPAGDPFAPATLQFDFANGLLARHLYREATAEYDKFLKTYPQDARRVLAHFYRGEARFALRKYRPAALDYYAYLKQSKYPEKRSVARLRYGCCQFELKQFAAAAKTLRPLTTTKNTAAVTITAQYYLGRSLQVEKKYPGALAALQQVKTGELAPLALFARAEILAVTGKHPQAAATFAAFNKQYSTHALAPSAVLAQGEELREAGQLRAAAQSFLSIINAANRSPTARAQAQYGLAWVRYNEKTFATARDLASAVIKSKEKMLQPGAYYLLGLSQYQLHAYPEALAAFAAITQKPYAEMAARQTVWTFLANGDAAGAHAAIAAHQKRYPNIAAAEMILLAGKAYMRQQKYAKAISTMQPALKQSGNSVAEAAYEIALCHGHLGAHKKAAAAFAYFAKTWPQHPRLLQALIGQGRALLQLKEYAPALAFYTRIRARKNISPALREAAMNQEAVCYYWLKQYANMRKTYQAILQEFPAGNAAAEALYWLAWYETSEKRFSRATELYRDLEKRFPQHALIPQARYRRAMSRYHAGQPAPAAALLYAIITRHKKPTISDQEILWLGAYYVSQKKFAHADTVYAHLLQRNPNAKVRAIGLYRLAEVQRAQAKWQIALVAYQKLLRENDAALSSAASFGMAVCERNLGKLQAARTRLDALKLSPNDPLVARVHVELGHLDFAAKKYDTAAAHWMRVGLLYDDEALCGEALYWATRACLKAGDHEKAQVCIAEVSGKNKGSYGQRYPKNPYVAKTLALSIKAPAPPPPATGGQPK